MITATINDVSSLVALALYVRFDLRVGTGSTFVAFHCSSAVIVDGTDILTAFTASCWPTLWAPYFLLWQIQAYTQEGMSVCGSLTARTVLASLEWLFFLKNTVENDIWFSHCTIGSFLAHSKIVGAWPSQIS